MRKTTGLAALTATLVWGWAQAADHFDAPFTDGVIAGGSSSNPADINLIEKSLDIADVYVFPTNGGNTVAFIMTIFPFADSSSRLNPDVLYQFKIDTNDDQIEDQVIQVTVSGTGSQQQVSTSGVIPAAMAGIGASNNQKAPSVLSTPFNQVGGDGTLSLFAGLSDDPFFFDLTAFRNLVRELNGGDGRDGIADNVEGFTPSMDPAAPNDTLTGLNIISIVVEVPKAQIGAGGGTITLWATTHLDSAVDPQS